jgi:hypothetical protein
MSKEQTPITAIENLHQLTEDTININSEKPSPYKFLPNRNEAKNIIVAYVKEYGELPHGSRVVSVAKNKEFYLSGDELSTGLKTLIQEFTYEELIRIAYDI